jgi:hypothetical protein
VTARRCHGRFKKAENKKLEVKQLRTKGLAKTWLRRQKPTKGYSAKW